MAALKTCLPILIRRVRWMGCLVLIGLLAGCVQHRQWVYLILGPKATDPLKSQPTASLKLGLFKDSRPDATRYLLLSKPNIPNPFKPIELAYLASNSVAGVLRDGMADALGNNGFKTFHSPTNAFSQNRVTSYLLCGDIQSAGCRNIQRLFAHSIIKTWLTVRFDLVDETTGLTVWHDTYTGQNTATNQAGAGFLLDAFVNASDDLIGQLISDRNFRSYFEP